MGLFVWNKGWSKKFIPKQMEFGHPANPCTYTFEHSSTHAVIQFNCMWLLFNYLSFRFVSLDLLLSFRVWNAVLVSKAGRFMGSLIQMSKESVKFSMLHNINANLYVMLYGKCLFDVHKHLLHRLYLTRLISL